MDNIELPMTDYEVEYMHTASYEDFNVDMTDEEWDEL